MKLTRALKLCCSLLLASCGSPAPVQSPTPSSGPSCATLQTDARNALTPVLEGNAACTQDSDCISVGFGASCFDSCSRAIAASGKSAFDAAVTEVNTAGACKTYADRHCPAHQVPPCAPPMPPTCQNGTCQ